MLEHNSAACQTLQTLLDSKHVHYQTPSMKQIFEDYEAEKRKREEEPRKREEEQRKRKEEMKDLTQLFLRNANLKNLLTSEPQGSSPQALAKWKSVGPVTIDYILEHTNLDKIKIDTNNLEYQRVETGS